MATLAVLPEGDGLLFTRLQDQIALTPGNLITHVRKLEEAGYLETKKSGTGTSSRTTISLTLLGRRALDAYTAALRGLLEGL